MILIYCVGGISIISLILFFNNRYPTVVFWISFYCFLDVGGFFKYFALQFSKINVFPFLFFIFLFIPIFSTRINTRIIFRNKQLASLILFLTCFLFYHIIIYGFIVPQNEIRTTFYFIVRYSPTIFGGFVLIPAYLIIREDTKVFLYISLYTSLFFFGCYLLDITGFIEIPTLLEMEREGVARLIFPNFIFLCSIIPMAMLIFISNANFRNNRLFYLACFMASFVLVLSMSRLRIIVTSLEIIVACILLLSFVELDVKKILKLATGTVIVLVCLFIFQPTYTQKTAMMYIHLIDEFTSSDSKGKYQSRTEFEIPMQLNLLKKNMLWGTGYDAKWYNNGRGAYNGSDTPYLAGVAMFGGIGITFYLLFYVKILRLIIYNYRKLKSILSQIEINRYKEEVLITIFCLAFLIVGLLNVVDYFKELLRSNRLVYLGVIIGMLCAQIDYLLEEKSKQTE